MADRRYRARLSGRFSTWESAVVFPDDNDADLAIRGDGAFSNLSRVPLGRKTPDSLIWSGVAPRKSPSGKRHNRAMQAAS